MTTQVTLNLQNNNPNRTDNLCKNEIKRKSSGIS